MMDLENPSFGRAGLPTALMARSLSLLFLVLVVASDTFAQTAEAPPALSPGAYFAKMMPMFIAVFAVFYLLVLRPQQSKLRDQQKLLNSLTKGDLVVTSGGMVGKVVGQEGDLVAVEIANGVKVKFEPAHISKRFSPAAPTEKTKDKAAA